MLLSPGSSLPVPPKFVVFEGLNGAGKSTLIKLLVEKLSASMPIATTFEPGATTLGKQIRSIVLGQNEAHNKISPNAELLLFAADRAEHISKIIQPALDQGKLVLSDRYFYSTLAFQGYGRGLPLTTVGDVCEIATNGLRPDLVVLLDLDVATALSRTKKRGEEDDSFEAEAVAFHERLRNGFLSIARERPEPFLVLSALQKPEELAEAVFSCAFGHGAA